MSDEPRPPSSEFHGQTLPYPARQSDMVPSPDSDLSSYRPAGKLRGKVALITGGDSGIGRAVAVAYAMEGADVAIVYNVNDDDANTTRELVEAQGSNASLSKLMCASRHSAATPWSARSPRLVSSISS